MYKEKPHTSIDLMADNSPSVIRVFFLLYILRKQIIYIIFVWFSFFGYNNNNIIDGGNELKQIIYFIMIQFVFSPFVCF